MEEKKSKSKNVVDVILISIIGILLIVIVCCIIIKIKENSNNIETSRNNNYTPEIIIDIEELESYLKPFEYVPINFNESNDNEKYYSYFISEYFALYDKSYYDNAIMGKDGVAYELIGKSEVDTILNRYFGITDKILQDNDFDFASIKYDSISQEYILSFPAGDIALLDEKVINAKFENNKIIVTLELTHPYMQNDDGSYKVVGTKTATLKYKGPNSYRVSDIKYNIYNDDVPMVLNEIK